MCEVACKKLAHRGLSTCSFLWIKSPHHWQIMGYSLWTVLFQKKCNASVLECRKSLTLLHLLNLLNTSGKASYFWENWKWDMLIQSFNWSSPWHFWEIRYFKSVLSGRNCGIQDLFNCLWYPALERIISCCFYSACEAHHSYVSLCLLVTSATLRLVLAHISVCRLNP